MDHQCREPQRYPYEPDRRQGFDRALVLLAATGDIYKTTSQYTLSAIDRNGDLKQGDTGGTVGVYSQQPEYGSIGFIPGNLQSDERTARVGQ